MKSPERDSPAARARSQEAAAWLARRDRGLSPEEQDAFFQWLAADPRHGEWLALHRQVIGDFSALAGWGPELSEEPNPDLLAPLPKRPSWLGPTLWAAAAAASLALAALWIQQAPPDDETAPQAEQVKRRLLGDGSAVELNRGAVVTFDFDASFRRATLTQGEAYFRVAHDPARPFIVRAHGVDVRAVGTAFTVRVDPATVNVVVTDGKVAVSRLATAASHDLSSPESQLKAGERAIISLTTTEAVRVSDATSEEISRHLDWQPLLLDFSSAPLGVALNEFNRRNSVQFVLADQSLASLPIVASIRSDNVDGFARFLAEAPGVVVEREGPSQIVIRRKP